MAAVVGRSTRSLAGDSARAYNSNMGAIEKLELLVKSLSPEELAKFREWFAEFDAQIWDRQIEADAAAGKLDRLIDESMAEHRANKSRQL